MLIRIFVYLFPILNCGILFSQIEIEKISTDSLSIWSSNEFYIYEFYLKNNGETSDFEFKIESEKENSIIKVGLANFQIDSLNFTEEICQNERLLVRILFKNIPFSDKNDDISIQILYDSTSTELSFNYKLADPDPGKTKLFQSSFSKYLIMDLGLHSAKEVILYDEKRLNFEHITSRSRFLDLSFLSKGTYIIEIDDDEYVINKE
jgi:hypothetical protein